MCCCFLGWYAGSAREPLCHLGQRFWERLQEQYKKGWTRTWILQITALCGVTVMSSWQKNLKGYKNYQKGGTRMWTLQITALWCDCVMSSWQKIFWERLQEQYKKDEEEHAFYK